jgi:hypothetical protein
MEQRLRVVQRPPKSDKITLAQAKQAWLKVERESAERAASKRAAAKRSNENRSVESPGQESGPGAGAKRTRRQASTTKGG